MALLNTLPLHQMLDIDARYLVDCEAASAPSAAQTPMSGTSAEQAPLGDSADPPTPQSIGEALDAGVEAPRERGESSLLAGMPTGAEGMLAETTCVAGSQGFVQGDNLGTVHIPQCPPQQSAQQNSQSAPASATVPAVEQASQDSIPLSAPGAQNVLGRATVESPSASEAAGAFKTLVLMEDEDADLDELLGMSSAPQRPALNAGTGAARGGATSVVASGRAQVQPSLEDWLDDL